ncbi:MAG: hypothetical protein ABI091_25570 [Ferruginibacter sp.]
MDKTNHYEQIVKRINESLPLHSMWDGFWVHYFKAKTLIISASFDMIYYRDYDLIFKKVIFFNVPERWRDTDISGEELVRLSTEEEFAQHHPGFSTQNHFIFAIDIHFARNNNVTKYTFFIVAKYIYLVKCEGADSKPDAFYTEKYNDEMFPCIKNRV